MAPAEIPLVAATRGGAECKGGGFSETSSVRPPIVCAIWSNDVFTYIRRFVLGDQEVRVEAMLTFIELVISPARSMKCCVVTAFDDTPSFDDQDLIRASNG